MPKRILQMIDPKELPELAKGRKKAHKKLLNNLKRKSSKEVDQLFRDAHEEAFEAIDCLNCANCCKTTGPRFTDNDINRIAKSLRQKPGAFTETYLRVDEDGDYVLQQLPCPFLENDNRCSIYDVRPKACREYPHTDRIRQTQLFPLTMKNRVICPAVFRMMEQLAKV